MILGNAVWRLGRLAPGASRTIRGTVRIEAASPGIVRNLVAATSVNAHLAGDRADTRILAPRRPPPVTG